MARVSLGSVRRAYLAGSLVALAVVGSLVVPAQGDARSPSRDKTPASLHALLEGFRSMRGLEAHFREEKHVALLSTPLRSEGRLYFLPPDRLTRAVHKPKSSMLLISPERIVHREGGKDESIDLGEHREIKPLVKSMLWLFSGNEGALRRTYDISFTVRGRAASGKSPSKKKRAIGGERANPHKPPSQAPKVVVSEDGWDLVLKPRSKKLATFVRALRLEGRGYAVHRITVDEPSGGSTVTEITSANPKRRFSPSDRRRLFLKPAH